MRRIGQLWKEMGVEQRLNIILEQKAKMATMGEKDKALIDSGPMIQVRGLKRRCAGKRATEREGEKRKKNVMMIRFCVCAASGQVPTRYTRPPARPPTTHTTPRFSSVHFPQCN